MNKSLKKKEGKKIKAWACFERGLVWHEGRPMVYQKKSDALFNNYVGHKIVRVDIAPVAPTRK